MSRASISGVFTDSPPPLARSCKCKENGRVLLSAPDFSSILEASSRISDLAWSPASWWPDFLIPFATALRNASCPTLSLCFTITVSIFIFSSSILFLLSSNLILTEFSWLPRRSSSPDMLERKIISIPDSNLEVLPWRKAPDFAWCAWSRTVD